MNSAANPRRGNQLAPLWTMGSFVFLLAIVRLAQRFPIPWPRCGLRSLTGIPCPLCGSTHSLIAWSHFDPAGAFAWNPLFATGCVLLCVWFVVWLIDLSFETRFAFDLLTGLLSKRWLVIGGVLLLANWIYLILRLPKF